MAQKTSTITDWTYGGNLMQLNPQIAQNGIVYHNHKSFIKNAKKMKMKKVEDERRYNQA